MAVNRKRHTAQINIAPLAKVIGLVVVAGFIALVFVYLKNGLHPQGGQIKGLERELAELVTKNEVLKTKIAALSSRATLQRRLNEGFIKMIPISDDRIVRVSAPPERIAAQETGGGIFK